MRFEQEYITKKFTLFLITFIFGLTGEEPYCVKSGL